MELETIKHELLLVKKEVDAFRHFYGVVSLELLPENDNAPMEEVLLALKQLVDDNDKHIRQTWALSDYICDKKYCNRGVITGDQSKL